VTDEIVRVVSGSRLYGTNHPDSDEDMLGVFVEPPHVVFSGGHVKSRLLHDRGNTVRASAGETDGVAYSLRHFCHLALQGNPSVLTVLFAPPQFWAMSTPEWEQVHGVADRFVSMKAAPRFRGYMQSQWLRLTGQKSGHVPSRPELVEQFGFDTKYAAAVLRLGLQRPRVLPDGDDHVADGRGPCAVIETGSGR